MVKKEIIGAHDVFLIYTTTHTTALVVTDLSINDMISDKLIIGYNHLLLDDIEFDIISFLLMDLKDMDIFLKYK